VLKYFPQKERDISKKKVLDYKKRFNPLLTPLIMKKTRKQYTDEFKTQARELVAAGRSVADVAADLAHFSDRINFLWPPRPAYLYDEYEFLS
jgi:hypothetical protein